MKTKKIIKALKIIRKVCDNAESCISCPFGNKDDWYVWCDFDTEVPRDMLTRFKEKLKDIEEL